MQYVDDAEAERFLNEQDRIHGLNTMKVEEIPEVSTKSLGQIGGYMESPEISAASESTWKLLDLRSLPSQGLFYPADTELLLRSAKTKEIRHWSTIDENDPLDVREKINFVLNSCTKIKVLGGRPLNFNDFLEIDRYHILFRLYELTFPNQENKLWANVKCDKDSHINHTQVVSSNLIGFKYPEELMRWYSEEDRCFKIVSEKLNETFYLYLPTIGIENKFRLKRKEDLAKGVEIDEAFYEFGPYLIKDWRGISNTQLTDLKFESVAWPENKFVFIHKFTNQLKDASLNKVASVCEKCKEVTESHIFLEGSFTVKDIFIISIGLNELI
ncbi:hypothetical protein UFOVP1247_324 [uncultured Caudovirales phage]|uniref:Uncharacterized protein n=1 Tax=uncultured Caudovirales phage TaxID=2100421 RepID=A0A6J5RA48_9CAUD|nr:hypothetical protein UFOVP970_11 [uncultured Caudovirales phage]CAB4193953.1 hypothetical protein UFOVP1247_324 [uncultured Caudovirales phage]